MDPRRGDVYLVNLEPTKGSEQGKQRPAVILQNDQGNKHSPTTIIAPMTSSQDKTYSFQVKLDSSGNFLNRDSTVLLNQIRTVSREHRLIKKLGSLSPDKMKEVDQALRVSLGLR
jgi:mRNA interferase MazF